VFDTTIKQTEKEKRK